MKLCISMYLIILHQLDFKILNIEISNLIMATFTESYDLTIDDREHTKIGFK